MRGASVVSGRQLLLASWAIRAVRGTHWRWVLPMAPGEYSRTKITRKSGQQRAKIEEKSTQEPSKIDVGSVLGGFKRSTSLRSRSRTRSERLWDASLAVLAAKLAVSAAMLAVLDGKLAAHGDPNDFRSRPRTLFERVRTLDRRRERSEGDF